MSQDIFRNSGIEIIKHLDQLVSRFDKIETLDDLAGASARVIEEVIEVEYSGLFLLDPETNRFRLFYAKGFTHEEFKEAERTALGRHPGWVFKNKKIFHIDDTLSDQSGVNQFSSRSFKVRSRLFVPVISQGECVGAYGLSSIFPHTFNEAHKVVLKFASNISGLIYSSILFKLEQKKIQANLMSSIQQLEKTKQLKEKFLANVSHEIRTPLNGIIGMSSLLGETNLSEKQKEFLYAISVSSEHLLSLVNNFLDFSKIEARLMELEQVEFSLRDIILKLKLPFKPRLKEKNLSLEIYMDEDVQHKYVGDPCRLNQVCMNLLSNAIKFTEKGEININIKVINTKEHIHLIKLEFTDTGIGISQENLGIIFDSFRQADYSTTRKYGGTGLGLSICKEILHLMNGTLEVKSTPQKGSTFTVVLPLQIANTIKQTQEEKISTANKDEQQAGKKVLLVEDDRFNAMFAENILKGCGSQVIVVSNGKEAIEILQKETFDIILMDIQMPEMDGFTATTYIRNELGLTTPILALTANAVKEDYERGMLCGMNDLITKPYSKELLISKIGELTAS